MGRPVFTKPLRHGFAVPPPLPRGGLGIPESLASSPEAPLQGATATTAASGGNREELLGQRPAGCKRQRSRRWEPQPGLGAKRLRGCMKDNLPVSRRIAGEVIPSAPHSGQHKHHQAVVFLPDGLMADPDAHLCVGRNRHPLIKDHERRGFPLHEPL